jgi:hypothetical protein
LAADWYSYLDNVQLENDAAMNEAQEALQSKKERAQSKKKASGKEKNKDENK